MLSKRFSPVAPSPPGPAAHITPGPFYDASLPRPPSHLRQVPDHQEVFADREVGISVVVEVLSFEEGVPSDGTENGGGGGSSARYFFDDLASANGALSSTCDFCVDMTDR